MMEKTFPIQLVTLREHIESLSSKSEKFKISKTMKDK